MPVMLPTILRNLAGGPATRLYPVTPRDLAPHVRGQIAFVDDKCMLCGTCAIKCPADAISVNKETKKLSFYPLRCIVCEVCVTACPTDAITLASKWRTPVYDKPIEEHEGRAKKPRTPM